MRGVPNGGEIVYDGSIHISMIVFLPRMLQPYIDNAVIKLCGAVVSVARQRRLSYISVGKNIG